MQKTFIIGTRESELAVWQANFVKSQLEAQGYAASLLFIKSDGDIDLQTPLYEIGVQGIFTRSLDMALLHGSIDIAVHSMKDVPTQLPAGIAQAAVLKRVSYKDIFVFKNESIDEFNVTMPNHRTPFTIATSSIRRKAQWLHRYPNDTIDNLRGNVNTRLKKVAESNWQGAIFAAAGLERINLRPANAVDLDWMLPAPAQGAIMVVCKQDDAVALAACNHLNDAATAICTKVERDFLRALLGGCSTPISALAEIKNDTIFFKGNIVSVDGKEMVEIDISSHIENATTLGAEAATQLLAKGGDKIAYTIRNAAK